MLNIRQIGDDKKAVRHYRDDDKADYIHVFVVRKVYL